jgi:hypothetical protein
MGALLFLNVVVYCVAIASALYALWRMVRAQELIVRRLESIEDAIREQHQHRAPTT